MEEALVFTSSCCLLTNAMVFLPINLNHIYCSFSWKLIVDIDWFYVFWSDRCPQASQTTKARGCLLTRRRPLGKRPRRRRRRRRPTSARRSERSDRRFRRRCRHRRRLRRRRGLRRRGWWWHRGPFNPVTTQSEKNWGKLYGRVLLIRLSKLSHVLLGSLTVVQESSQNNF